MISVNVLFSQEIGTTKVKVMEGFKPFIPDAKRLSQNATFADTIKKDRTQNFEVLDADLKSNYKVRTLRSAKVKPDKLSNLYKSRVSLGTGYRVASKVSAIYNSTRSKDISYGLIFNHFNNNISIDKKLAGRSDNNLHIYAKKIKKEYVYIANLDYNRLALFSYGIGNDKESIEGLDNNPYYNRFSYMKFSFFTISTDKTYAKMLRNTTFFISDFNEYSENQIHLNSNLRKIINRLPINIEITFDHYLNYNNPDTRYASTSVRFLEFSPSTKIKKYGIDFNFGLKLHYLSDGTPFSVSPEIKAAKELVKDVLLVYGGLRHSDHRNTFKTLSDENPYIHSFGMNQSILEINGFSQNLRSTHTDEFYIAMRNRLAKNEVFHAGVSYGKVQNFTHFIGIRDAIYDRFSVDYVDVRQLHVNANYTKEVNNIISLDADVNYYKWDKEIYHKPNFSCAFRVPVNLRNKIKVSPTITYRGVSISKNKELDPQFQANLGLYYSYSKQLSFYLQFDNLTNSKKELWHGYKQVGFSSVFGLNYSF